MPDEFEALLGEAVEAEELAHTRARDLVRLLSNPEYLFGRFLGARKRKDGLETVLFEVDVERPQHPVVPIKRCEPIAAAFRKEGQPSVFAIRGGFPETLHQNPMPQGLPASLCLDDRPWVEARSQWTAFRFVGRIRWWLAAAAMGNLHGENQALEPLLQHLNIHVILPKECIEFEGARPRLCATYAFLESDRGLNENPGSIVLKTVSESEADPEIPADTFVPFIFKCSPQEMQRLSAAPRTLSELNDLLLPWGAEVLGQLKGELYSSFGDLNRFRNSKPLFIVILPLLNDSGEPSGEVELRAFTTPIEKTVSQIGIDLGLYLDASDQGVGPRGSVTINLTPDLSKNGENISLLSLEVHTSFDRDVAARGAGLGSYEQKIGLVGVGSLGSNLVEILRRDGFGCWRVIDNDVLLPHNIQRHRLIEPCVGMPKAQTLAEYMNHSFGVEGETTFLHANVLGDDEQKEAIAFLKEAELIVDASASVAVARALSDWDEVSAKRISVFFNPSGTDAVILAEDSIRSVRLDALESQYYRAVLETEEIAEHISLQSGTYRYSAPCRAVSFEMPNHQVAMLSGALAREVRAVAGKNEATIIIWSEKPNVGLIRHEICVYPVVRQTVRDWEVTLDQGVLDRIADWRQGGLPDETGGVLLGVLDTYRRAISIVTAVPAPPDSHPGRSGFVRGVKGLLGEVESAGAKTAGQVQYVGEWHSHPEGVQPLPSQTDIQQLVWLGTERSIEDLPAIMLIMGDGDEFKLYLAEGGDA